MTRRHRIAQTPQDQDLWEKYFKTHKEEYLRVRLRAIKLLWSGYNLTEVKRKLNCSTNGLNAWIDAYLEGGFEALLQPWQSGRIGKTRLTPTQQKILKYIIIHKSPSDYGFTKSFWTLALLSELMAKKWKIILKKSRIQQLLTKELGLSYQKFHRDYKEASKKKQKDFLNQLSNNLNTENQRVIWFDEFSLSTQTETTYGWAVRNSSPTVPSCEKKKERRNVLLAVEQEGTCQFTTNQKNTAEQVAAFMLVLALKAIKDQISSLLIILDNASQHKKKMKNHLKHLLQQKGVDQQIQVDFLHTAPYSPQMNAAEYNIGMIRHTCFKHLPCETTIEQRTQILEDKVQNQKMMNAEQMNKVLKRIRKIPFL